jgi:DNA-binding CsgD family transcriptional regulator
VTLFILAGLLATLASGFITLTLLASKPEIRGLKHFGSLIANMLLFNLLVILGLAWRFLNLSYLSGGPDRPASSPSTGLLLAALLVLGLLKLAWAYSFQVLALELLESRNQAGLKAAFGVAAGLLIIMTGAGWAPFLGEARLTFVFAAFLVLEYIVMTVVIGTSVVLIFGARRHDDGRARKAGSVLGAIYFALFTGSLVFLAVGGNGTPGARETYGWANVVGLLLFNPALYIWAKRSARVFRGESPPEICYQPDLVIKYGISGREFEIISLICQGKTNQEIADELRISAQTVKDHNYNIFQKTGVRNRTQLARLFMKRTGG